MHTQEGKAVGKPAAPGRSPFTLSEKELKERLTDMERKRSNVDIMRLQRLKSSDVPKEKKENEQTRRYLALCKHLARKHRSRS